MKIEQFIVAWIFVCFQSSLFGQYKLTVRVTDCSDRKPVSSAQVLIQTNDSLIRIREKSSPGEYVSHLDSGNYNLFASFFYYEAWQNSFELTKDTVISICLNGENSDSLLMNYTFQPSYILYTFGMPMYSDEYLSEIGEKYGVLFFNLGCVVNYSFEKYNQVIHRILEKRNGKDWQQRFWNEVHGKSKE